MYSGTSGLPGSPLHVPRRSRRSWYILDAEVAFTMESRNVHGGAATFVLVPRSMRHIFRCGRYARRALGGHLLSWPVLPMLEERRAVFPTDGPPDPQTGPGSLSCLGHRDGGPDQSRA
jgi:hypothetical protein